MIKEITFTEILQIYKFYNFNFNLKFYMGTVKLKILIS